MCRCSNPGGGIGTGRWFGFNLGSEAIYPKHVQGINLVDCWALDDRGADAKMQRGAYCETVHDGSDDFLANKLTRFRSIGHTVEASLGFHEPYVCISGVSGDAGTLANDVAAGTSIVFDPSDTRAYEAEDSMKMHSTPTSKQNFRVREEGVYEIRARVVFQSQNPAVGYRKAWLIYDGNIVLPTETVVAPVSGQKCSVNITHIMRMVPGKTLLLSAYQNSGGSLTYLRDYGLMAIRKISD